MKELLVVLKIELWLPLKLNYSNFSLRIESDIYRLEYEHLILQVNRNC